MNKNLRARSIMLSLLIIFIIAISTLAVIEDKLKYDFLHWTYKTYVDINLPQVSMDKPSLTSFVLTALIAPLIYLFLWLVKIVNVNSKNPHHQNQIIPLMVFITAIFIFLLLAVIPSGIGGIGKSPLTFFGQITPIVKEKIDARWDNWYRIIILAIDITIVSLTSLMLILTSITLKLSFSADKKLNSNSKTKVKKDSQKRAQLKTPKSKNSQAI